MKSSCLISPLIDVKGMEDQFEFSIIEDFFLIGKEQVDNQWEYAENREQYSRYPKVARVLHLCIPICLALADIWIALLKYIRIECLNYLSLYLSKSFD